MKGKLIILTALITLTACQTTPTAVQYPELSVTDGLMTTVQWQALPRVEPAYPIEAARDGKEGCATLEYVITPDYQITDVRIVETTARYFAREAQKSLPRWQWQSMPAGLISTAVKTQTRFEFCLENKEGRCAPEQLAERNACSGTDVLPVVGYRVMKPG